MTLEEMLALLPDNNVGEIGANDIRAIVSDLFGRDVTLGQAIDLLTGLKGAANGVAELGADSLVPLDQIPLTGIADSSELRATYGAVDVDLSGGNVTLAAASRSLHLTGATAARVVTFPAGYVDVLVENATNYEHTLIRTGSASGVPVSAGATIQIQGA